MDDSSLGLDDSKAVKLTGKIMMIGILVLFSVVVFVLCLHLYAKWYWRHNVVDSLNNSRRRRRRFVFAPGQPNTGEAQLRSGLDPLVLNSLPLIVFNPQDFKNKEEGLECAVCLSDIMEGEKIRMLPKCEHGFHVECIDMWFASHSTCPLCRHAVEEGSLEQRECSVEIPENSGSEFSLESPNFPTNVLFWGDQNMISSGGPGSEEGTSSSNERLCPSCSSDNRNASRRVEGRLVIDIPSERAMALSLGSPSVSGSARFVEEDLKSPMVTRLRSLKRMLSRDSTRISPCSTSSGVDLEAGGRAQTPQS